MPLKLSGTLIYGLVTIDINRAAGDFNNNVEGRKYDAANNNSFPRCCRNGTKNRTISITTDDIVQALALEDCGAVGEEFEIPLSGFCEGVDQSIQTVAGEGLAFVRDLNIPTVDADTVQEATFDLIIVTVNGLEPVEVV